MNRNTFATAVASASAIFVSLALSSPGANAAELKWLAPVAMKAAVTEMAPKFEQTSGHKVKIEYATVGLITERLRKGEAADIAIVSGQQLDDLVKEGKIAAGSRAEVAKVGFGLLIRKGAKKSKHSRAQCWRQRPSAITTPRWEAPAAPTP